MKKIIAIICASLSSSPLFASGYLNPEQPGKPAQQILGPIAAANEAAAKAELQVLRTGFEMYHMDKSYYPKDESELISGGYTPSGKVLNGLVKNGYRFTIETAPREYTVTAEPVTCGQTGNRIFTLHSGADISEDPCREQR